MRWMKWAGVLAASLLIVSCFLPWVFIESRAIQVTGMDTTGTNFGKPGYFHIIFAASFILLTLRGKLWSARCNLFVGALNLGWAIRNYFIITQCRGGDCPLKQEGIYLMLIASILVLAGSMFPGIKLDPTVTQKAPGEGSALE